jgi:hypothetical protein
MASIVLELQEKCTDSSHDIIDLLRKAKLVAVKLGLAEFTKWIDSELNGYDSIDDVPEYRRVRAQLKAFNPYRGLISFMLPADIEDLICDIPYNGPLSSAVSCLSAPEGSSPPTIPLTTTQRNQLMSVMDYPLEPVRTVSVGYFYKMIDAVRSKILDWSLRLEQEGIIGDGLTFSTEEKRKAAQSMTYNITNFQGVLGNISDSILDQHLSLKIAAQDIGALKSELLQAGLTTEDVCDLESAIQADGNAPAGSQFGQNVSKWMGRMMTKASDGSWAIGMGAGGNLLATALKKYFGIE